MKEGNAKPSLPHIKINLFLKGQKKDSKNKVFHSN